MSSPSPSRFRHYPPVADGLVTLLIRVPPEQIGFICSILEAYDGIAVSRTRDQASGLMDLWVMPGQRSLIDAILDNLRADFPIQLLGEEPGHPDLSRPS